MKLTSNGSKPFSSVVHFNHAKKTRIQCKATCAHAPQPKYKKVPWRLSSTIQIKAIVVKITCLSIDQLLSHSSQLFHTRR